MNVKTLTGSSIQAALAKARDQLGDHVVLMESSPATDDEPARITVMVDEPATDATPSRSRRRVPAPADTDGSYADGFSGAPPAQTGQRSRSRGTTQPTDFGYGGSRGDGAARTPGRSGTDSPSNAGSAPNAGSSFGDALSRQQGTGRGRFFPSAGENNFGGQEATTREEMLEAQLKMLNERLDGMERRFGGAIIGSGQRWTAHPLFGSLLDKGMRPGTVTKLFEELVDRGHDPENSNPDELRWALAQVLCKRIQASAPKRSTSALALIGPGGVGKTSLILKLATHRSFFARREPTVIHLLPEDDRSTAYQNPTDLYRSFGLPVQNVRNEEEMVQALNRVQHFGQVLIDTPPMPLPLDEARSVLRHYERLLRPLMPLDVHLVLSATHAFDAFEAESFERLPIAPGAMAITRLDEVGSWGRIVEWLMTLDLPVQYVSDSPRVPDGAHAFSSSWFVEEMMGL